jgi:hypothetical protein
VWATVTPTCVSVFISSSSIAVSPNDLVVTNNYLGVLNNRGTFACQTSGALCGRRPARSACLDRIGKTANQLRRARTHLGWKTGEDFSSLGDESVSDFCIELLPRGSCRQLYRALITWVSRPRDIPFAFESAHHSACSTLIEVELGSKLVKRATVATNQDV